MCGKLSSNSWEKIQKFYNFDCRHLCLFSLPGVLLVGRWKCRTSWVCYYMWHRFESEVPVSPSSSFCSECRVSYSMFNIKWCLLEYTFSFITTAMALSSCVKLVENQPLHFLIESLWASMLPDIQLVSICSFVSWNIY